MDVASRERVSGGLRIAGFAFAGLWACQWPISLPIFVAALLLLLPGPEIPVLSATVGAVVVGGAVYGFWLATGWLAGRVASESSPRVAFSVALGVDLALWGVAIVFVGPPALWAPYVLGVLGGSAAYFGPRRLRGEQAPQPDAPEVVVDSTG